MKNKKKKKKCEGKQRYSSFQSANAARFGILSKKAKKDPIVSPLNVYRCSHCKHFHLGREKEILWDLVSKYSKPKVVNAKPNI